MKDDGSGVIDSLKSAIGEGADNHDGGFMKK